MPKMSNGLIFHRCLYFVVFKLFHLLSLRRGVSISVLAGDRTFNDILRQEFWAHKHGFRDVSSMSRFCGPHFSTMFLFVVLCSDFSRCYGLTSCPAGSTRIEWTGILGQRHNIYGSICRLFVASLYFLYVRSRFSSYPMSSQVFNACGRIFHGRYQPYGFSVSWKFVGRLFLSSWLFDVFQFNLMVHGWMSFILCENLLG